MTTTGAATATDSVSDELLDGLAAAAERACDDTRTRAVLRVVVQRLEDAAGAGLGSTDGDPLVVLQRRLGRAHTRLAGREVVDLDAPLLHELARALEPQPAAGRRATGRATAAAALAGC